MLDPTFNEAWTHAPKGHTVLGRKLHPLCALDLLTMEALNSPFMVQGGVAEVHDLLLLVWVLSNPPAPDCSISNLELSRSGQDWMKRIVGEVDMVRDCAAIENYIRDYYSIPEVMHKISERPFTALGSPWMLSTVVMVTKQLRVSLFEAWTMPIGMLVWYRCSLEELESEDYRIVDPKMRAQMEKAKTAYTEMKIEAGESIAHFAERIGISEAEARGLMGVN